MSVYVVGGVLPSLWSCACSVVVLERAFAIAALVRVSKECRVGAAYVQGRRRLSSRLVPSRGRMILFKCERGIEVRGGGRCSEAQRKNSGLQTVEVGYARATFYVHFHQNSTNHDDGVSMEQKAIEEVELSSLMLRRIRTRCVGHLAIFSAPVTQTRTLGPCHRHTRAGSRYTHSLLWDMQNL